LPPQAQELVLSQLPAKAPEVVAGLPHPLAQTREYLFRFRDIAPAAGQSPRASLWEASIEDEPEGSLNGTYLSRTGLPMEGTAWATYTAVMISFEAARAGITADTEALVEFLTTPGRTFDTGKGPVGFRPEDHQLLQPLYMVQVDPEARWTPTRSAGVSLARSLGRIPAEPDPAHLDTLGGEAATACKD